ncbi:MAG TPA: HD domain-containing protein, partial [Burkholderiales bacterium]|nr:HD domain-containing protein [Burkholderiales bacterium]
MANVAHLRLVQNRDPAVDAWLDAAKSRFAAAELDVVSRAADCAATALEGRSRASGEPALAHALGVADVLLALRLDHEAVAAALLFATLGATANAAQTIREQFGRTIGDLADGVARMDEIGALSNRQAAGKKPEQQAAQLE